MSYIAKELIENVKEKDFYRLIKIYFKLVYMVEKLGHRNARKNKHYPRIVRMLKKQKVEKPMSRYEELIKNLFEND